MNARLGTLAAAFTGAQVAAGMLLTRALGDALGPATLGFMRYAIALAVLAAPFWALRRAPMERRDLLSIAVLGAAQFGLLIWLLNLGLARVGAAPAAVVFAAMPALTLALAVALGIEAAGWRKWLAVALVLAGVAAAAGPGAVSSGAAGSADLAGLALVLAAAATGAATALASRPFLTRYRVLQVGVPAMAAALAALAVPALAERPLAALAALGLREWALVLGIGLSSGAGYLVWLTALRHLPPGRATLWLGLSPVLAALCAPALLGEAAGWGVWAGLVLVLAGLGLGSAEGRLRLAFARPRG